MATRIRLHHPVTGHDYEARSEGHAEVMQRHGWVLAPDGDIAPFDVSAATVAELRAYAAGHGIDLTGATRKAEIAAAITASLDPPQEP